MFCTIHLSKSDPTPLYIQLARELSKSIKNHELKEGTKLPAIRDLSHRLKINRDTVVSAYKLLENQGLISPQVGSGTYVNAVTHTSSSSHMEPISCSTVYFDKSYFSPTLVNDITKLIVKNDGWGAFTDPLYRNRQVLRVAIENYMKSLGVLTSAAQVRFTTDFLKFLIELHKVHPGSTICMECYHDLTYSAFLHSLGFKIIPISLQQDGMDLEELESSLKVQDVSFVWISSYVQNPTCISYSDEKKKTLLKLAENYHFYIVEDGTFNDYAFASQMLTPIHRLDYSEYVIFISHFSKLYLPDMSYTFIALPTSLSKKLNDYTECTFNERFLYFYLESPLFSEIRQTLITKTHHFAIMIHEALLKLAPLIEVYSPCPGPFFWIRSHQMNGEELMNFFLKHQLILSPGELFTTSSKCHYYRFSLPHLTETNLTFILDCLKELETTL